MRRALERHHSLVAARLAEFNAARARGVNVAPQARRLARFHARETANFQHERLIHLLVTLFFAGFLLALLAGLVVVLLSPLEATETTSLAWALAAGCVVVAVLEAFYIQHYYQLENGVQRLYQLDLPLADLSAGDGVDSASLSGPPTGADHR
ncbi:MAG: hypothetical protein LBD97_05470 [Bifidobacteriaceae bacterium]|jgi:hypothetical protein|nr:hypothetical protein [Bifidobacteriaceae bacterium]